MEERRNRFQPTFHSRLPPNKSVMCLFEVNVAGLLEKVDLLSFLVSTQTIVDVVFFYI